ncbi:MAG: peptidylprolyl isomerase [Promethearchaeota archaeon]
MAIKKGDIIKVKYEGRLEDGTVFDSTDLNEGFPLKFEVGSGEVIDGFDKAVIGKDVGEEFSITLQPSEAYGEFNPTLQHKISKDKFPKNIELKIGMMLRIDAPNGSYSVARITEIDEESVTIDMNHPLAGKVLNFKIKIIETGCEPDPPSTCGCGCGEHKH